MTSAPTRVLFVSSSLGEGGAQRVTSTLLCHLDRERVAPSLYLLKDVCTFPLPKDVPVSIYAAGDRRSLGQRTRVRPWLLLDAVRALRRHIERTRPDVVVSVIDQVSCLIGTALVGMRGAPRWIARGGTGPDYAGRAQRLWTGWALPRADVVVVNAAAMVGAYERTYPGTRGRVRELPNPIDFERLDELATADASPTRPSGALLLSVTRFTREKRVDVLIAAMELLRRRVDARLWICGDGELRPAIEAEVRARGLAGAIDLLGFRDNPYALARQADLFVLSSEIEGLPNALIEAQGLGLPAVATDCDFGPREVVEQGVTGLLTPPNDADRLAGAIAELLSDGDRRASMAAAARTRARARYGIDVVLPRWERLLVEATG